MGDSSKLVITYGLGYVFNNNKYIGVIKTKEVEKEYSEFNIYDEIERLNSSRATFYRSRYVEKIEEALDENLSDMIPIIIKIKRNGIEDNDILEEYYKSSFMYKMYKRNGFTFRDISYVEDYLDKCFKEEKTKGGVKYDKATLKVILTTSFGKRLGDFIGTFGQDSNISDEELLRQEQIKKAFKNSKIMEIDYSNFDFLTLIKDLAIYEESLNKEKIDYTELLRLVSKDGSLEYKSKEFQQNIISFLKGKKYLYFTYAKYGQDMIITTVDSKRYLYKENHLYNILSKNGAYIYDPTPIKIEGVSIDENHEYGFLLSYNDEKISVCAAILNKNINRVDAIDKLKEKEEELASRLKKYIEGGK